MRCTTVFPVVMNDAVSVGGGGLAWEDKYEPGDSTSIPGCPSPCECVGSYGMKGGELVDACGKAEDGSDGQRECALNIGEPMFKLGTAPLVLRSCRYCLRLKRK